MASVFSALFLFLCVITPIAVEAQPKIISLGSLLSPATQPSSWSSPSGRFAFGFYPLGDNRFVIGVWLVGKPANTLVWMANRDDPPVSSNATLRLTMNGRVILSPGTEPGEGKSITSTSVTSSYASMLDSGNFVLYSIYSGVLWESFSHPTSTLLGGQFLSTGNQLISSVSETDCSSGRFRLKLQNPYAVLYPINTPDLVFVEGYWNVIGHGSNLYLHLDNSTGILSIRNGTDHEFWRSKPDLSSLSGVNETTIFRATLDNDGIFRGYAHGPNSVSTVWEALSMDKRCEVKGICGFNSYCRMMNNKTDCLCLPGFDFVDPNQKSLGCQRSFTGPVCKHGEGNITTSYNVASLQNISWGSSPYFSAYITEEECRKSCSEDCVCGASVFKNGWCDKHQLPLRYARLNIGSTELSTAFFKIGTTKSQMENSTQRSPVKPVIVTENKISSLVLVALGFFGCSSCFAVAISVFFVYSHQVLKNRLMAEMGSLGQRDEFTLRLFSYNELQKATEGFKEELGRGSFGAVYRGTLSKGKKVVAVKRLEKVVEEGEREFRAEMRAIGKTHHRNLLRLLGYCAEGSNRLLVYEYMSNGSLANLLFKSEKRPCWDDRLRIALDVAKGILYLHEECEAPIIHCDIKPQNILMDDFWTAKISDFGLAKLLMPDQTRTFTQVRGTRGYLAPEWQRNTPISVKTDVYSYGVVLLEIVCCRRNMDVTASTPDEIVLSTWVYYCFVTRQLKMLIRDEDVDMRTLETMVKVGLWCIQDETGSSPFNEGCGSHVGRHHRSTCSSNS
uniref:Receptor-like serine/threonine-protein kinase n=1 Tax=Nelumbo nucifera TaxID=4432 RepID=A0A822Z8J3_NELNU|nr:TPA_asm: hypothetical protein HUJ06_014334 [Nelumbo nucifera]